MPGGEGSYDISHFRGLPIKMAVVAGGAAGAIAVTGIEVEDQLLAVVGFGLTEGTPNTIDPVNLTDEFTVSADDEIDNTGGTATTGDVLFVLYNDKNA